MKDFAKFNRITIDNILLSIIVFTFYFNTISDNHILLIYNQILFVITSCFFIYKNQEKIKYIHIAKTNRWILFTMIGLLASAVFSCFYSVNFNLSFKDILSCIIRPFFYLIIFLIVGNILNQEKKEKILYALCLLFIFHIFITSIVGFFSNAFLPNLRTLGCGGTPIVPYAFFLTTGIATLIFFKKIYSIPLFFFSLIALYFNGSRSSIVILLAYLTVLFLFYRKIKILFLLFSLACCVFFAGELLHKNTRANFLPMFNNFLEVWNTPPLKMEQFDRNCYKNDYFLQYHIRQIKNLALIISPISIGLKKPNNIIIGPSSLDIQNAFLRNQNFNDIFYIHPDYYVCINQTKQNPISYETSALMRISMFKSALQIISQNILIPHGYSPQIYQLYLQKYNNKDWLPYFYPYTHLHNGYISAFFELGLIGFVFYLLFPIFCIISITKLKERKIKIFYVLMTCGLYILNFFDIPLFYFTISTTWYSITGFLLSFRKDSV